MINTTSVKTMTPLTSGSTSGSAWTSPTSNSMMLIAIPDRFMIFMTIQSRRYRCLSYKWNSRFSFFSEDFQITHLLNTDNQQHSSSDGQDGNNPLRYRHHLIWIMGGKQLPSSNDPKHEIDDSNDHRTRFQVEAATFFKIGAHFHSNLGLSKWHDEPWYGMR